MPASTPLLGSVDLWPIGFAPLGFVYCQGQTIPISGNEALFSLISTQYGGDGVTTFGLPDLRGRVPVGVGKSPNGTKTYGLGQLGGSEGAQVTTANLPAHTHTATLTAPVYIASGTAKAKVKTGMGAGTSSPANNFLGPSGNASVYFSTSADATMAAEDVSISVAIDPNNSGSVQISGAGTTATLDNRMLFIAMNYLIAMEGLYPVRD